MIGAGPDFAPKFDPLIVALAPCAGVPLRLAISGSPLPLGLSLCDGLSDGDALRLALDDGDAEGEADREALELGDTDGDTLGLTLRDGLSDTLADGETEADAEGEALAEGDTLALGETEADGDVPLLNLDPYQFTRYPSR